MTSFTLSQYRALPRAEKNALVDKYFYKRDNPSGRDYIAHAGNTSIIINLIYDAAKEKGGRSREIWFEMGRYLHNPYKPGSSLSRFAAAFMDNPRNTPGLMIEAYFIATGLVIP